MTKKAFDKIMEGARQALEIAQGKADPATYRVHVPDRMDVRAIRRRLGYSQTEFASRFGFRLDTLRKWEQRTRRPEGAARAYLKVIANDPQAVMRALAD